MQEKTRQNCWFIKSNQFYDKPKKLIIDNSFIKFGNKELIIDKLCCDLQDKPLLAYRFGIKWIRGFEFTIGRVYQIFIRNKNGDEIKISFASYYGFKKVEMYNQYAEIINKLWYTYFDGLSNYYLELLESGNEFNLVNVHFTGLGIKIKLSGILKENEKFLKWEDVGTKDYQTYFAIFSKEKPSLINKSYSYLDNWNTGVLFSVVKTRLKRLADK